MASFYALRATNTLKVRVKTLWYWETFRPAETSVV